MASTTKSTTKSDTYDSKSGSTSKPAFTELTIIIESRPTSRYVGRSYKNAPTNAKYWGETLDTYLSDFGYDEQGARYRIQAKPLTEEAFEEAYKV